MGQFDGRVALVTGAGSGLGRATAQLWRPRGRRWRASTSPPRRSRRPWPRSPRSAATARAYTVDVSDPTSVRPAVDRGGDRPRAARRSSSTAPASGASRTRRRRRSTSGQKIIGVNLTGTFLVCQAAIPYLLDGGGSIVNIASNAGLMGQPYSAAYCASKGGVVNLTRALADEYLKRKIRVNCIAPGGIDTPLQNDVHADAGRCFVEGVPQGHDAARQLAARRDRAASRSSSRPTRAAT